MTNENARQMAALELFKNSLAHHETLSGAVVSYGQAALKMSLMLNGGAVVAALSLYGALASELSWPKWSLGFAVAFWISGLMAAWGSAFLATEAQRNFQKNAGNYFRLVGRTFFDLQFPDQDSAPTVMGQGLADRLQAKHLGYGAMAAFVAGALSALIGLVFF